MAANSSADYVFVLSRDNNKDIIFIVVAQAENIAHISQFLSASVKHDSISFLSGAVLSCDSCFIVRPHIQSPFSTAVVSAMTCSFGRPVATRVEIVQYEHFDAMRHVYLGTCDVRELLGQFLHQGQDITLNNDEQYVCKEAWQLAELESLCRHHKPQICSTSICKNIDALLSVWTPLELYGLLQANSEHCRHWIFRGQIIDAKAENNDHQDDVSLMDMVKSTLGALDKSPSLLAFCDNASAIKGPHTTNVLRVDSDTHKFEYTSTSLALTLTAETHNFPTGICPFEGAATGVGGRQRDSLTAGRGSLLGFGTAGYSVSSTQHKEQECVFASPRRVLLEASDGASDYANKSGEPILCGYSRVYEHPSENYAYVKPIMFTAGIGTMLAFYVKKCSGNMSEKIVKIGGPAYRIGMGGGQMSSRTDITSKDSHSSFDAVQRGDAFMGQKLSRVIRSCIETRRDMFSSIHDQGAGGNANVITELCENDRGISGRVYLNRLSIADSSMSPTECWCAEYQESVAALLYDGFHEENFQTLTKICAREGVHLDAIGYTKQDKKARLKIYWKQQKLADFSCRPNVETLQKIFVDSRCGIRQPILSSDSIMSITEFNRLFFNVLSNPNVGSKRYLTTKADRSVTGLVAQQQCVGLLHVPLADYAVQAHTYEDATSGTVSAIGERGPLSVWDVCAMARVAAAEALTNMAGALLASCVDEEVVSHGSKLHVPVMCSANWMWPASQPGQLLALKDAVRAVTEFMTSVGMAIDGGKDSLSMTANVGERVVSSPGTLVVSTYACMPDVTRKATPAIDWGTIGFDAQCRLYHVCLAPDERVRLAGSIAHQINSSICDDETLVADVDSQKLVHAFNWIQKQLEKRNIYALHDVSDGGLVSSIVEIAIASTCSVSVTTQTAALALFDESPGFVFVGPKSMSTRLRTGVDVQDIGSVWLEPGTQSFTLCTHPYGTLMWPLQQIFDAWDSCARDLERDRISKDLIEQESTCYEYMLARSRDFLETMYSNALKTREPQRKHSGSLVGIIRAEGCNSDRELAAAFMHAGAAHVYDICMTDLLQNVGGSLDALHVIAFPGGFSYADVLGAGYAWASILTNRLSTIFEAFKQRENTKILGVCNGCQLLARLQWIPGGEILPNVSNRFESRYVYVRDEATGQVRGTWSAHAQGRFSDKVPCKNVRFTYYTQLAGIPVGYPTNPNGSHNNIAGVQSDDRKIIGIMPHPERSYLDWQVPLGKANDWVGFFEEMLNVV